MLQIDPRYIVGREFTALDPKSHYKCIGYAANETFLIVGTCFDSVNNRSDIKTFKIQDVKFIGDITAAITPPAP